MISNQLRELHVRSGLGVSVSASEPRRNDRGVRTIAPFYVPTTGAVRLQAGPTAIADMTPDVERGKAHLGVPSWSPPA
ncbi:MAG TPA: hypothetical protein VFR23_22720 [Jiangellaceae bacterium]|nr:hypothetical protein [Jiangellaceae bacterium]